MAELDSGKLETYARDLAYILDISNKTFVRMQEIDFKIKNIVTEGDPWDNLGGWKEFRDLMRKQRGYLYYVKKRGVTEAKKIAQNTMDELERFRDDEFVRQFYLVFDSMHRLFEDVESMIDDWRALLDAAVKGIDSEADQGVLIAITRVYKDYWKQSNDGMRKLRQSYLTEIKEELQRMAAFAARKDSSLSMAAERLVSLMGEIMEGAEKTEQLQSFIERITKKTKAHDRELALVTAEFLELLAATNRAFSRESKF